MIRTFKEVSSFTKKWKELGLTEDDLVVLEELLLKDTKIGDVIQGTEVVQELYI